jgi:4-hydroxyphenylpyruvate dioxygenase-like putative hemolysin
MDLRELEWKGVDFMHLAQDRNQWQALVNTIMNLGFHKRWKIS